MKSSPSRGKLHSHSHAHRLSEESWGRDTRLWKLTKQILLFSLSFAVALHLYVKQSTLGGAPRPNGRSLREAEGARSLDTALLGDGGESGWASLGGGFVTPQRSRKSNSAVLRSFDWEEYLRNYPQLRDEGIDSRRKAESHFLSVGRAQGRVGRRLRVILRYTAGTGLINQHYSHVAALVLAELMGAELVLPPAMHRSSFEHIFSVFKGQSAVKWAFAPLDSLYDVDALVKTWKKRGVVVHKTPRIRQTPDLSQPQTAFPSYVVDGGPVSVPDMLAARVHNVFGQNLDPPALVARARAAILDTVQAALRLQPDMDIPAVAVDLPCTFFMLNAVAAHSAVNSAARTLQWAPPLRRLADRVIAGMMSDHVGSGTYNGVHLRIEKDAGEWARILGGRAVVERRYRAAMRRAHFDKRTPLYVASALLTYDGGVEDLKKVVANLTGEGLASNVVYKEMFLTLQDTKTLHSEQKGLIDFLVLAQSGSFVGFGPSTYSFFLSEYRTLQGMATARSVLVDGSKIGTDPLFQSAGVLNMPEGGWPNVTAVYQQNSQQASASAQTAAKVAGGGGRDAAAAVAAAAAAQQQAADPIAVVAAQAAAAAAQAQADPKAAIAKRQAARLLKGGASDPERRIQ
mmetsp:Transcript_9294/g.27924  ORF Transcript_9294/g.27924 Transcript_9294/m.27924 type:complete len:628 (+) Transcript_9294:75-1958(+)